MHKGSILIASCSFKSLYDLNVSKRYFQLKYPKSSTELKNVITFKPEDIGCQINFPTFFSWKEKALLICAITISKVLE